MNIEKIAAELALTVVKETSRAAVDTVSKEPVRIKNAIKLGFNKYLTHIYGRCSETKTILYRSVPVSVDSIYVNSRLRIKETKFSDVEIIQKAFKKPVKYIVSGTGGSGKSMLAKFTVLHIVREQNTRLPIFFELRKLNKEKNRSSNNLLNLIWKDLNEFSEELSYDRFLSGVKSGKFIFILDGLDEVDHDIKNEKEEEIRALTVKYSKNSFIIFSRPDDALESWHKFILCNIQPMEKDQIKSLVSLVEFDEAQKNKFISDLDTHLYEQHRGFVSIPLLATMMLMTYEQYANVPDKLHIFYWQVFDVLFSKHDVRKDGKYIRKFHTSLAIDDFSKILQVFCATTYFEEKYEFTKSEALEYISDAIKHVGIDVDKTEYFNDLQKSVCLLIQEGSDINFSHRSFQEYFTALFISNCRDVDFSEFYLYLKNRILSDKVMVMLYGIDSDLVNFSYLKPNIEAFLHKLNKNNKCIQSVFLDQLYYDFIILDRQNNKQRASPITINGRVEGSTSDGRGVITFSALPTMGLMNLISMWYPQRNPDYPYFSRRLGRRPLRAYMFALASFLKSVHMTKGLAFNEYNKEQLQSRICKNKLLEKFVLSEVERLKLVLEDISSLERNKKASIRMMLNKKNKNFQK